MRWLLLPVSALVVDVVVIVLGGAVAQTLASVLAIVFVHLATALAFGVLLSRGLARMGQEAGLRMALLAASLAFFVPAIGGAALTTALYVLLVTKPKSEGVRFQRYKPVLAITRKPPTELVPRVVTDRLVHLVRHGRTIDTRFRAVLQSNDVPAVVAVPILKAALSDAAEEVRLSAFSQIEKMRRAIDNRIEKARTALAAAAAEKTTSAREERNALQAALAQDYFEIAYLGLAEGEVYKHSLKQALEHAEQALAIVPDDAATLRIVARIRLRQSPGAAPGQTASTGVRSALDAARSAGIPFAELATDYAEEAFRRGAYGEVARILASMADVAHDYVLLARVQEFWRWR